MDTKDLKEYVDKVNGLMVEVFDEKFANVYLLISHSKEDIESARKLALDAVNYPKLDTMNDKITDLQKAREIAEAVLQSKASNRAFYISLFFSLASLVFAVLNYFTK